LIPLPFKGHLLMFLMLQCSDQISVLTCNKQVTYCILHFLSK